MNTSALHVVPDTHTAHYQAFSSVPFSQFLYIDLRHEQGVNEVVIDDGVTPRQRRLIEEHLHTCGARKSIKLTHATPQTPAITH